jgi:hypothetical protein
MEKMTKPGLLRFIDMCNTKGLINANTGGGRKAAAARVLEDTSDDQDLEGFDVRSAVMRFNNRHPGALTPSSLRTYEVRLQAALEDYASWLVDPIGFKPASRPQGEAKTKPKKVALEAKASVVSTASADLTTSPASSPSSPVVERRSTLAGQVTETSLVMPLPMRSDFVAQIVVPKDMTQDEAERLCVFIKAIAMWNPKTPIG